MGSKALIRLLIIFAAVAAVALIVKFTGPGTVETVSGSGADREKVFPDFPEQVARIRIKTAEDEVNLVKGEETWEVAERGGHPAKQEDIVGFVRKVWDLEVIQAPEIGPSQFSRLDLLDPDKAAPSESATVVSFLDADGKELESLWLGKIYERKDGRPSMMGGPGTTEAGRYVKPGDEELVFLVDETFSNIEPDPAGWLDDDFFKVEKIKTIAINSQPREDENDEWTEADNWKLTRDDVTGDFTLVDAEEGEELDATKVTSMKSAFSSPKFDDVVVGDKAKENQPDRTTFTVETFDGFTYVVKASKKDASGELYLTYTVDGKFEDKRTPGEEESDEEKERLDKEFADNLEALREKLAAEKALAGKVYRVRGFVVDSINKKRSEILKGEEEAQPAGGIPGGPGAGLPPGLPPGTIQLPKDGSGVPLVPPAPPTNPAPAEMPEKETAPDDKPEPETATESKPAPPAARPEEMPAKPDAVDQPKAATKDKPETPGSASGAPTDSSETMPAKPAAAEETSKPDAPKPATEAKPEETDKAPAGKGKPKADASSPDQPVSEKPTPSPKAEESAPAPEDPKPDSAEKAKAPEAEADTPDSSPEKPAPAPETAPKETGDDS